MHICIFIFRMDIKIISRFLSVNFKIIAGKTYEEL